MRFSFDAYQPIARGLSKEAVRFGERVRRSYLGTLAVEPVLAMADFAAELAGYQRDTSARLQREVPVSQVTAALAELRKHNNPTGDIEIRGLAAALAVRGVLMADGTAGFEASTTQQLAQETAEALGVLPTDVSIPLTSEEIGQALKLADPFPKPLSQA